MLNETANWVERGGECFPVVNSSLTDWCIVCDFDYEDETSQVLKLWWPKSLCKIIC